MARIDTLDAWRLRLPLQRPYRLSFGPVTHYDTLLVRMVLDDGAEGFGEATLLTGYTDETIDGTWDRAQRLLAQLGAGRTPLADMLDGLDAAHPFLATAFRSAHEMASGSPLLRLTRPQRVPLLGLLQADGAEALGPAVESLLAQGFGTLKLKVGFDAAADALRVAAAQRAVAGRATLRLDANQGYSRDQALGFVDRLDPQGIELFEQPCAAGDWPSHLAVAARARARGLALMLDEAIYTMAEIEQAAQLDAARFIKVKLMKFGGLARLDSAVARIRALGMVPVLGNGVATELSCWQESCIAARRIDNAGEMNGFLKPSQRLFVEPLPFADGAVQLPSGYAPRVDLQAVARCALAHAGARGPLFTRNEELS